MQGLNVKLTIYRPVFTVDVVGGADDSTPETTLHSNVRARMSNAAPTIEMRAQGIETDHLAQASIFPAHLYTDIKENDFVSVVGGIWDGIKFLVTGVRRSSVRPGDPRSHIDLMLLRTDEGRTDY